jgi:hypothetical protein
MVKPVVKRAALSVEGLESRQLMSATKGLLLPVAMVPVDAPPSVTLSAKPTVHVSYGDLFADTARTSKGSGKPSRGLSEGLDPVAKDSAGKTGEAPTQAKSEKHERRAKKGTEKDIPTDDSVYAQMQDVTLVDGKVESAKDDGYSETSKAVDDKSGDPMWVRDKSDAGVTETKIDGNKKTATFKRNDGRLYTVVTWTWNACKKTWEVTGSWSWKEKNGLWPTSGWGDKPKVAIGGHPDDPTPPTQPKP